MQQKERAALTERFEPALVQFGRVKFGGEGKSGKLPWPGKISRLDRSSLPAIAGDVFVMTKGKRIERLNNWEDVPPKSQMHPAIHTNHPPIRLNNSSPGVTGRCGDSLFGPSAGSYMVAHGTVFGPWYHEVAFQSKLVMFSSSYLTAPGAAIIHAWGVKPNAAGIDIGTGCNRLHVENIVLLQTFVTAPRLINRQGFSGLAPFIIVPWDKTMSGSNVVVQGAWVDSVTGRLSLTQARQMTLPTVDLQAKGPVRMCTFQVNQQVSVTTGPFFNPALRYSH